jgi:hypothetical protein
VIRTIFGTLLSAWDGRFPVDNRTQAADKHKGQWKAVAYLGYPIVIHVFELGRGSEKHCRELAIDFLRLATHSEVKMIPLKESSVVSSK